MNAVLETLVFKGAVYTAQHRGKHPFAAVISSCLGQEHDLA